MTTIAPTCAAVRARPRCELIQRRLARFREPHRAKVVATAARHARLADLALSFPALLFALSVPRPGASVTAIASRVIAGASLAELAELARVPLWLRRLPPEAFGRLLPSLPAGELFRRQVVNHLPVSPKRVPDWLDAVANASLWADESLAIWIARELYRDPPGLNISELRRICLWAWYSLNVESDGLCRAETPWEPSIGFFSAKVAARRWLENVALHLHIGAAPIADTWVQQGESDGLTFVPLRLAHEIAAEAAAMKNCLRIYGEPVARNRSRLFSVRRDSERIATLEISLRHPDPLPRVVQIRVAENKNAPPEMWTAARRWLEKQQLPVDIKAQMRHHDEAIIDRRAWIAMWRPYWIAKQRIPAWLPLAPPSYGLREI